MDFVAKGIIPAMVTPLMPFGGIDLKAMRA
jgi:dihydrodipicolinate synthase/N-acetylneuraminate lyase